MSSLADTLAFHLRAAGIGGFAREYLFHPTRKWRFDFAWPAELIGVEVDGGQCVQGTGHNSGTGRERDAEKDVEAVLLGWHVVRFPTSMVVDGRALQFVERLLAMRRKAQDSAGAPSGTLIPVSENTWN